MQLRTTTGVDHTTSIPPDGNGRRTGLAVTPFALGPAASAVIAGRLVARVGRWLTVSGLTATAVGLVATALALRPVGGDAAAWATAGPLLVAGLGGGMGPADPRDRRGPIMGSLRPNG